MPWTTPTLRQVRETVRGDITTSLGRASFVANSVLRVMADAMAGLAHLVLRYIDWLALQLLPDTAETEWLDRHGDIWLVNADGTTGRKAATPATGTITMTGTASSVVPAATQLNANGVTFETTEQIVIGNAATPVHVRALNAGSAGNLEQGQSVDFVVPVPGVDGQALAQEVGGGTDEETDDELRARVLRRIRQPPMGGDATDYEQWALAVPGVTRAWCSPLEMGMGTVTVRFMMDDLRADQGGFPTQADVDAVTAYLDKMRPVTVKDFFVAAPIPYPINVVIAGLDPDNESIRAGIEASERAMLMDEAAPGKTIMVAWKNYAILNTPGVQSFHLVNCAMDDVMPSPGHMAVLGNIIYE